MLNKIVNELKNILEKRINHSTNQNFMSNRRYNIDKIIDLSIKKTLALKSENNLSDEEIIKKIVDISKDKPSEFDPLKEDTIATIIDKIIASENLLDSESKKTKYIEKKLVLSDWGEKSRAFLLRITTAIGIAIVVLAASYLAQKWGIPLPLRMGLPIP
jgi:hypothetical protein